jgi:hypothetical protein
VDALLECHFGFVVEFNAVEAFVTVVVTKFAERIAVVIIWWVVEPAVER